MGAYGWHYCFGNSQPLSSIPLHRGIGAAKSRERTELKKVTIFFTQSMQEIGRRKREGMFLRLVRCSLHKNVKVYVNAIGELPCGLLKNPKKVFCCICSIFKNTI